MITEEAQTLESFIKDMKATVLNICNELKETIHFLKNEEKIYEQNGNINKDIEIIKKGILELKGTII